MEISCAFVSSFYGNNKVARYTCSNKNEYFNSNTNQMHNVSNLFYFGTTLYMFRKVSPSIIRSLRLYIQHQI